MENNAVQGSKLLKVVGILLIVFGSFGLISALISIAGIALLIATGLGTPILYVALVLTIISAIVEFVAGIIGVKNWNKPEKAGTCIKFAIIMIALTVLGVILNIVGGQSFGSIAFSAILGVVLPILYFIGAKQLQAQQ